MSNPTKPRFLTPATVELLESSTSALQIASRDARFRPHMARVYYCRVDAERERVWLGISSQAAGALMDDVRANSIVALVACNIRTFYTIQVKGTDARLESADEALKRGAVAYHDRFVRELAAQGFSPAAIEGHMHLDLEHLLALTFTATAAFVQTPGPGAGAAVAT